MSSATSDDRRRSAAHVIVNSDLVGSGDRILLENDVAHHLTKVLRLVEADVVSVTDGAGSWWMTAVVSTGGEVTLERTSDTVTELRSSPFTLATAMPKGDRLDWLVQKTTEVGVDRIQLLHAERSVVRWKPERVAKQLIRLQRIADEATRQSRRVWRTEVCAPLSASDVLAAATIAEPGAPTVRGDEAVIAIGPEGGWSEAEIHRSSTRVGLGANILRTETAAVVAATLRMVPGT